MDPKVLINIHRIDIIGNRRNQPRHSRRQRHHHRCHSCSNHCTRRQRPM